VEACIEKILIVDSEIKIRKALATSLSTYSYTVLLASTGEKALKIFNTEQPNLIVLDLLLPKLDGYELCRQIREKAQTPIIILTALSDIPDRILGFELGADDYVLKPFSPKELEARIRSVFRRTEKTDILYTKKNPGRSFCVGNLIIDTNKRQVLKNNKRIRLTDMEFNLLHLLISKAGERLSRAYILDNVWGYTPERYGDTRVVDVHISRLRAKLEEDQANPDLIITARGTGYMFQK
jgi:OmpR family response regulator RpaB